MKKIRRPIPRLALSNGSSVVNGCASGPTASAWPVFSAEPQQDLARFARSFCRDLFSALPASCALFCAATTTVRARGVKRANPASGSSVVASAFGTNRFCAASSVAILAKMSVLLGLGRPAEV